MSKKRRFPTISIITGSYNTDLFLVKQSLEALRKQTYPQENIEHIVMDAGSTNGSIQLARSFGCSVFVRSDLLTKSQIRGGIAVLKAKGDIVLFLEFDNIILTHDWLQQMVQPFLENQKVVGTFSAWNIAKSDMPIFTRYCALFGMNDPLVYYLNKSEKLTQFQNKYNKGELVESHKGYDIIQFNPTTLPTLGDNGHMIRREMIRKIVKKKEDFIHTDVFAKLCGSGNNTFGVVYNSIVHYTGNNLWDFAKRRAVYKARHFDNARQSRAYLVYNSASATDRINLIRFSIFALTLIEPLVESFRGYLSKRDIAWFVHPIACFMMFWLYSASEIQYIRSNLSISSKNL